MSASGSGSKRSNARERISAVSVHALIEVADIGLRRFGSLCGAAFLDLKTGSPTPPTIMVKQQAGVRLKAMRKRARAPGPRRERVSRSENRVRKGLIFPLKEELTRYGRSGIRDAGRTGAGGEKASRRSK